MPRRCAKAIDAAEAVGAISLARRVSRTIPSRIHNASPGTLILPVPVFGQQAAIRELVMGGALVWQVWAGSSQQPGQAADAGTGYDREKCGCAT